MYCKNCGRELKDGVRFCDRCGQSVRKSNKSKRAERLEEIESLKEERLSRKKQMEHLEAEKLKKKKKKRNAAKSKKSRKSKKFIYIIASVLFSILVIAVISYFATYLSERNAEWKTKDESVELNSTPVATIQPTNDAVITPTPSVLPTVAAEIENNDSVNADGYRVCALKNAFECPYPTVFTKKAVTDNLLLNLMDQTGGATMAVREDKSSNISPAEMMKEYAQTLGGTISYSLAGDDWYGITITKNSIVYHRKCLTYNGRLIYYDFQYDMTSVSTAQYETYIEYIDKSFSQG